MQNEFENEFVETATPNFYDKLSQQLVPGRQVGDLNTFYLELVRDLNGKPLWFMFGQNQTQVSRDTLQLIEVTVKRIK